MTLKWASIPTATNMHATYGAIQWDSRRLAERWLFLFQDRSWIDRGSCQHSGAGCSSRSESSRSDIMLRVVQLDERGKVLGLVGAEYLSNLKSLSVSDQG